MEKYVEDLKEFLGTKRNFTKTMFKITGTIIRGVQKGRFTYEQGLKALEKLGGAN